MRTCLAVRLCPDFPPIHIVIDVCTVDSFICTTISFHINDVDYLSQVAIPAFLKGIYKRAQSVQRLASIDLKYIEEDYNCKLALLLKTEFILLDVEITGMSSISILCVAFSYACICYWLSIRCVLFRLLSIRRQETRPNFLPLPC